MTRTRSPQDFEHLDSPLAAAVEAVLAEPISEASVRRVRERAGLLSRSTVASTPRQSMRWPVRSLSRTIAGGLIAVAAVAALVFGISLFLDRGAGSAFAQVVEKVNAAETVRFTMTWRAGRDPEQQTRIYVAGDQIRVEIEGGLIQISDISEKRVLYLDAQRQLSQEMPMDSHRMEYLANPVNQLRQAKSDDAEAIGEEALDGIRCSVFRLRNFQLLGATGDMLMWVDPNSGLPVRFVIHDPRVSDKMEVRFEDFVWNETFEPGLFSLNVPDGFQSGEIVAVPKPEQPTPDKATLDAPNVASDGILSRDRVPSRIIWSKDGTAITALMREPESGNAASYRQNELRQWDVATGKLRWSEDVAGGGAVAASIDGRSLAVATGEAVQLRDAATGAMIREWQTDQFPPDLAFSPDGVLLALAVADWHAGAEGSGGVEFRNVRHGTIVRTIEDDRPTTFVAWSPDGKFVASSSNSGPIRLWNPTTGELARAFPGTKCAFSPDGRTIACTSMETVGDKELLAKADLYDLQTASLVRSLASERATPTSWLLSLAFSPQGGLLAAANWDGTVTVWDVGSGALKLSGGDHTGGVHTARFSPDGSMLATGSEDKTLRLTKLPAELRTTTSSAP
ncbi:MAG: hypothetical protein JNG89_19100 [Planctomycetaceae bacterium]|nr:hypothetical protein [Planctomycetaceae bacterium]